MNKNQVHIMLDIETMSTKPDAAIVSIAAVAIEPGKVSQHFFYRTVSLESSLASGGVIDHATEAWWDLPKNAEARSYWDVPEDASVSIKEALVVLRSFIVQFDAPLIWGNGVNFDNLILSRAYERLSLNCPWAYRQDMCFRTLRKIYADKVPEPKFNGIAHVAFDDANHQAKYLSNILEYIESCQR